MFQLIQMNPYDLHVDRLKHRIKRHNHMEHEHVFLDLLKLFDQLQDNEDHPSPKDKENNRLI